MSRSPKGEKSVDRNSSFSCFLNAPIKGRLEIFVFFIFLKNNWLKGFWSLNVNLGVSHLGSYQNMKAR